MRNSVIIQDGFDIFSRYNLERCQRWHPKGIDSWSLSDWATAAAGEMGEACNVIKKMNRVRDGLVGNKESEKELQEQLGQEIADTVIYLNLLSTRAGLNFGEIIRNKFNAVSIRNNFPDRI